MDYSVGFFTRLSTSSSANGSINVKVTLLCKLYSCAILTSRNDRSSRRNHLLRLLRRRCILPVDDWISTRARYLLPMDPEDLRFARCGGGRRGCVFR